MPTTFQCRYQSLGELHRTTGNLDKAMENDLMSVEVYNSLHKEDATNTLYAQNLAVSYSKLGETHTALGNLDKALGFYEDYDRLEKELYAAYPTNVFSKNGLANSYSFLGETHTALGNLDKALGLYEDYDHLEKELYAVNPTNVDFKNGLAISYAQLGAFSKDNLKNKSKARAYFKQAQVLWQALVRDAPQYVQFQEYLGILQSEMKDLD